jgi:DNA-binding NarL/FixJ family response regulator
MINLFLVHEIPLISNILRCALGDEADINIAGETTTLLEALEGVHVNDVDVVLVDARLSDQGALKLIYELNEFRPDVKVVVIGLVEKKEAVLHFLEAGADGYVAKDSTLEELNTAIRLAYQNQAVVPPRIATALMERLSEYARIFSGLERGVINSAGLTPREMEVLELLGQDMTNTDIADALYIEVGTVKNHVHSILNKLNVTSRGEAANYLALIRR